MDLHASILQHLRYADRTSPPVEHTMTVQVKGRNVSVTFHPEGSFEPAVVGVGPTLLDALGDAAVKLGIRVLPDDKEPILADEAEALLRRLSRHFNTPVAPVDRYCDAIRTWAACLQKLNQPGFQINERHHQEDENKHGQSYASLLHRILTDISKSSLLFRLIYAGQKLRTRPCPEHKGVWSGIGDCKYGCAHTGWLPEPEDLPLERFNEHLASIEKKLAAREGLAKHQVDRLLEARAALMEEKAYLYPETPGTGCQAPMPPKHAIVFVVESGRERQVRVSARFDPDPFLLPTTKRADGKPFYDIKEALVGAWRFVAEVNQKVVLPDTGCQKTAPYVFDEAPYVERGMKESVLFGTTVFSTTRNEGRRVAKLFRDAVAITDPLQGFVVRVVESDSAD